MSQSFQAANCMLYIYLVDPSQFKLEFRTSVLEWVANILGKSEMQIRRDVIFSEVFRAFYLSQELGFI